MPEPQIKPRRPYDARRRRQQADRSRNRIIEVAEGRFLAEGYATTSVAAIAQDAGVSVDTIYKAFGGKPGLVRAIYRRALEGGARYPPSNAPIVCRPRRKIQSGSSRVGHTS